MFLRNPTRKFLIKIHFGKPPGNALCFLLKFHAEKKYFKNVTNYEFNRIFDYDIIRNSKSNKMKTTHQFASMAIKTILVAGILFSSTAFKRPSVVKTEYHVITFKDTVPDAQMNINIDIQKILSEIDKSLAKIDFDKIAEQVEASIQKIDFTKMQKDIEASLKNIDWNKINISIDSAMKNIDTKKMNEDIKKSLREAQKQLNSKEFRQSLKNMNKADAEKMKKELKKAKIEMDKSVEQIRQQLQKVKDEHNAVINDVPIGVDTIGPIII